jgi:membrane protein implicated in regulation of membrane protease activity
MALWRFVLLDLVGALAYAGLVVGLGYAIGHPAAAVVSSVTHYALVVTVVLIVVMVAVAIWHQRRRRTRPSGSQGPNRGDTGAPGDSDTYPFLDAAPDGASSRPRPLHQE